MSSSSYSTTSPSPPELPLPEKPVPGDYGRPFFGPIRDRLAYFYHEGRDKFFENRIQKYQSTILKTNMPPGPFISSNSRVICLLDAISFPVLFDTSKVEKRDVLDGTFLPSLAYTGGHRVCAYLDPSEPSHNTLKSFILSTLAARHHKFIPLFQAGLSELFNELEATISTKKEAYFNTLSDAMSFNYVFRLFCDKNPSETKIGSKGPKLFDKWLICQLSPLGSAGLLPDSLSFIEDFLLHSFPLPFFLVKSDYKKLYDAFYEHGSAVLDEAEGKFGIERSEACHNMVFFAGFNAYGGMKILFPGLIKWVASAGQNLHKQLADEIRAVIKAEGGVSLSALNNMPLTKSVVYEYLRIDPPVPYQYGKAKVDLVVRNHDAAFLIKKGEMLFGYQPFATKDPKVFEKPEEFVGDRFVGEQGEKLLKYVYWSNGRETEETTAGNKVCAAKDLVVLMCRVMLVELFLHYDTFEVVAGTATASIAPSVTFKSLTKASSSI